MKRVFALLLALMMTLCLCSCTSSDSDPDSSSFSASKSDGLTDSQIKSIVASALYDKIVSKYKDGSVDADSCTYSINKTETKGDYVYAYGNASLYTKYGKFYDSKNFEISIKSSTGSASVRSFY